MVEASAHRPQRRLKTPFFWGFALLLIGTAVFLWSAGTLSGKRIFKGTVTALRIAPGYSHGKGHLYFIVAHFRDEKGKDETYTSDFTISDPGFHVGDEIPLFRTGGGGQMGIATFAYQFGMAFGIVYAGLLVLFSPIVLKVGDAIFHHFYTPVEVQSP